DRLRHIGSLVRACSARSVPRSSQSPEQVRAASCRIPRCQGLSAPALALRLLPARAGRRTDPRKLPASWRYPFPMTNLVCSRYTSVRPDNLSGLDVDEDVLLALFRRLDLDHVDILAALLL